MPNSGVNTGFAKCFIFFMSLMTLIQGGVYLGLSIWGITLKQCSEEITDFTSRPLKFTTELIYFLDAKCGSPSVKVPDRSEPVTLQVDFSKAQVIGNRTLIFLITYAVVSSLWVLTSLSIIATLCGPVTKTVKALCFWPWFGVVMAGSILDAVATAYHIRDIINTTSLVNTFDYLGITADEEITTTLSNFDAYFITPAVIMTCLSCRVIFIWLLNIVGSSFCLSLSNTLSNRNSSKQCSSTSLASTSTYAIANIQQQPPENAPTHKPQEEVVLPQSEPGLPIENLHTKPSPPMQTNQNYKLQDLQSANEAAPSSTECQTNIDAATTYNNTAAPTVISGYYQELSPLSPLNKRYSTTNEIFQLPIQNQRVSEELRGQLPWSYTSMPPAVQKKPEMPIYPEIPAPDYNQ